MSVLPLCFYAAAAEAAKSCLRTQRFQASVLLDAARQGDTSSVAQVLEKGCPVDAADPEGRTALMVAAAQGHLVSRLGWGLGLLVGC